MRVLRNAEDRSCYSCRGWGANRLGDLARAKSKEGKGGKGAGADSRRGTRRTAASATRTRATKYAYSDLNVNTTLFILIAYTREVVRLKYPGQELRCNHASVFVRKQCMVSHATLHGAAAQRGQIISRRELAHHLLPQLVLAHRSSLFLQLVGRSHPEQIFGAALCFLPTRTCSKISLECNDLDFGRRIDWCTIFMGTVSSKLSQKLKVSSKQVPLPFRLHFCELLLPCYSSVLEPLLLVDRHGLHLLLFLNLHYCLLNGLRNQHLQKEVEFTYLVPNLSQVGKSISYLLSECNEPIVIVMGLGTATATLTLTLTFTRRQLA